VFLVLQDVSQSMSFTVEVVEIIDSSYLTI
jgi:hypothetical protein